MSWQGVTPVRMMLSLPILRNCFFPMERRLSLIHILRFSILKTPYHLTNLPFSFRCLLILHRKIFKERKHHLMPCLLYTSGMKQVILGCTHLICRQDSINSRYTSEIPVFLLRSIYFMQQMHMNHFCHIRFYYEMCIRDRCRSGCCSCVPVRFVPHRSPAGLVPV